MKYFDNNHYNHFINVAVFRKVPQAAGPSMPAVSRAPPEMSSFWPEGTGTSPSGTSGDINQVHQVILMVMVVEVMRVKMVGVERWYILIQQP